MIDQPEQSDGVQAATVDALLIDELQRLLERQLELARGGSHADLEELGERANALVAQMAEARLIHSPAFDGRKPLLDKLYKELYLTLAAQQQETSSDLRAIRSGKRMIAAYRRNP
jgi:hypothetical protein